MLHPGYRLAAAQFNGVIDECDSCLDSHHLVGKLLCLGVIERHFVALVQEDPSRCRRHGRLSWRVSRSFSFVKQLEPAHPLDQYKTVLSDG